MLPLTQPLENQKVMIEDRERRQGSNNRNGRHGDGLRLHGIQVIRLHAFLAASVGCRHVHAAAVALHQTTAGFFLRRHLCIGKGTRHRRRQQRGNKRQNYCEMSG